MKITQSWKRNAPSTVAGEGITLTRVYSGFDKAEIDALASLLPNGVIVAEYAKPVNVVQTGLLKVGSCPYCGQGRLNNEDNAFCGRCGMAVIW